jgi:hypothetical protein
VLVREPEEEGADGVSLHHQLEALEQFTGACFFIGNAEAAGLSTQQSLHTRWSAAEHRPNQVHGTVPHRTAGFQHQWEKNMAQLNKEIKVFRHILSTSTANE